MTLNPPDTTWPLIVLAVILLVDALISIRPPELIRGCLLGVGFPENWWWTLIVIKLTAAVGLLVGVRYERVGLAATVGVIVYFICAAVAHYRARFMKQEFWLNCLGMLAVSIAVALISFVL